MSHQTNTRPIDYFSLPIDWEVKTLGELGKTLIGLTYKPEEVVDEHEGTLVLRSSNVQSSRIVFKDNVYVKTNIPERAKVKEGDVLVCVRNGSRSLIGKSARINFECRGMAFGAFMSIYRSELNDYLFHIFQSGIFQKEINRNLGATINQITSSDLSGFKLPLPPRPDQEAIAHILGLMDSTINKNNQLISQKELQKKWLMQKLLTGKKRLKGFGERWKETSMGNLFERVTRKNTEDNTNVVTISAQRGFVRQTDFFNKAIASEIIDNYFLVEKGEFCYNKSYSNGYAWGATKRLKDFDKAVVTTLYICFGLKNPQTSSGDFFEQYFESNLLDSGLTKIAHEGGRAHGLLNVTPSDFFSLKITVPNYVEQTAIAILLKAADKELELLKTKTAKLREKKTGLMQVLLTGKKRLMIKQ